MPRGVKGSCDYAMQLQKIEEKIQKHMENLTSLREQKQDLLNRQRESDLQELYQYMVEHDLSSRDIIDQLISDQRIAESSTPAENL